MEDGMCASSFALILKDKNIAHAFILLQISNARHVCAEHLNDLFRFQLMQTAIMSGSLHYALVRADTVQHVVEPFPPPPEVAFDSQLRAGVRHHPHRPSRSVGHRPGSANGKNLGGSGCFIALTERAERRVSLEGLDTER